MLGEKLETSIIIARVVPLRSMNRNNLLNPGLQPQYPLNAVAIIVGSWFRTISSMLFLPGWISSSFVSRFGVRLTRIDTLQVIPFPRKSPCTYDYG